MLRPVRVPTRSRKRPLAVWPNACAKRKAMTISAKSEFVQ